MFRLMDYVEWRGDVDFDSCPFCEVDAIMLCQFEYNNLDGLVPEEFTRKGPFLNDVVKEFFASKNLEDRTNVGALINKKTVDLLEVAGRTKRYGSLRLSGYRNIINQEKDEQFAAITYSFKSRKQAWNCTVFRGTDDYIVGWKEDCKLCYMVVPAQEDSVAYLEEAASRLKGPFMVCGHSKGGNLSIYSTAHVSDRARKRVSAIYNFDGPGFHKEFLHDEKYRAIQNRIKSYYPRESIVGMLLNHDHGYTVMESEEKLISQHDPFNWHVGPHHFVECEEVSSTTRKLTDSINQWVYSLPPQKRKLFIETVFQLVEDTQAKTNTEFQSNMLGNVKVMFKSLSTLDPETRKAVTQIFSLLFKQSMPGRKNKADLEEDLARLNGEME